MFLKYIRGFFFYKLSHHFHLWVIQHQCFGIKWEIYDVFSEKKILSHRNDDIFSKKCFFFTYHKRRETKRTAIISYSLLLPLIRIHDTREHFYDQSFPWEIKTESTKVVNLLIIVNKKLYLFAMIFNLTIFACNLGLAILAKSFRFILCRTIQDGRIYPLIVFDVL